MQLSNGRQNQVGFHFMFVNLLTTREAFINVVYKTIILVKKSISAPATNTVGYCLEVMSITDSHVCFI